MTLLTRATALNAATDTTTNALVMPAEMRSKQQTLAKLLQVTPGKQQMMAETWSCPQKMQTSELHSTHTWKTQATVRMWTT